MFFWIDSYKQNQLVNVSILLKSIFTKKQPDLNHRINKYMAKISF